MSGWTDDAIVFPDLVLRQPVQGYRFNLDSLLLARLPSPPRRGRILDLGCGVGTVGLLLARQYPELTAVGLDRQSKLVVAAEGNARRNGLAGRCRFFCRDFADPHGLEPGSFTAAYLNPPYYPPHSGRAAKGGQRHASRQQTSETLVSALACARRLVKSGGYLHLILRCDSLVTWFAALTAHGFAPKRMRMIHGRVDLPAKVVLISARKGAQAGMIVEKPLIVYVRPGRYTKEMKQVIQAGRP